MKKIFLLVMVMLAVLLAGCGSNLKSDKPLTLEQYNKESLSNDDVTVGMRFNDTVFLAGTYEAKMKDGKKERLAAVINRDIMARTRKPEMMLLQNSSRSHVYKNGGIYHIFYTDRYTSLASSGQKTLQEHNILILDKDKKIAKMFINVKDDGSYDKSAEGVIMDFKEDDVFNTLKLQHP